MAPLLQSRTSDDTEALVLRHRRLARHLAQRYARTSDQREDLEQVACVGLVKAAQRFDPERGVAFTTFATPTILGELRRFCRDTRWAVHVPRSVQENVQALLRADAAHQLEHGRSPSVAEAARILRWSEEEVLEARMATGSLAPRSLNAPVAVDGGVGEAIDFLGSEDTGFADAERRDELQRALARLSARERRALQLRGEAGCTTAEIARRMGLTTPQASRLVGVAIRRLRAAFDGDEVQRPQSSEPYVRLADADPDLLAGLDGKARARARHAAVARRVTVPQGTWQAPPGTTQDLGLLVVSGALLRTVRLDARRRAELIGPGDVIQPAGRESGIGADASWSAVEPAELAVLDRSLCRWPSVVDALLRRAAERADALAVQLTLTDFRRAEDRVLGLFEILAKRWGEPGPDGVVIPVSLTHEVIAMLVGVHRPTATTALRTLQRDGRMRRVDHNRWLVAATSTD